MPTDMLSVVDGQHLPKRDLACSRGPLRSEGNFLMQLTIGVDWWKSSRKSVTPLSCDSLSLSRPSPLPSRYKDRLIIYCQRLTGGTFLKCVSHRDPRRLTALERRVHCDPAKGEFNAMPDDKIGIEEVGVRDENRIFIRLLRCCCAEQEHMSLRGTTVGGHHCPQTFTTPEESPLPAS
ncbi:hypothetical protein EVAR_54762_1 [Eumeta japonica]|uniref:Uncharacterized protein n=1 Tax=Eumeta variegata TaxID=151549 RepID=A0A4C1YBA7_EUMVA|nr:hypothetical protein EVAR_54762_1 [Eumeta japonica]